MDKITVEVDELEYKSLLIIRDAYTDLLKKFPGLKNNSLFINHFSIGKRLEKVARKSYILIGNYSKLVHMFIQTDELGSYDAKNGSISLYAIVNKPAVLADIRKRIDAITTRYHFIVLDPKDEFTNINILDIDL